MAAGSIDLAPNRVRLYRASSESTAPIAAPAAATRGRDMDPISSSWRNNSRNSNGGVTDARATCHVNIPRSPNHSRKVLMGLRPGIDRAHCPAGEGPMSPAAFKSRSLTGSNPGRERLWRSGDQTTPKLKTRLLIRALFASGSQRLRFSYSAIRCPLTRLTIRITAAPTRRSGLTRRQHGN